MNIGLSYLSQVKLLCRSFIAERLMLFFTTNIGHFDAWASIFPRNKCLDYEDDSGYDCSEDGNHEEKMENSVWRENRPELFSDGRIVLSHFEVKVVEWVIGSWFRPHVIAYSATFKATSSETPSICRSLFIHFKLHGHTDALHNFILVAYTSLFNLTLYEDGFWIAIIRSRSLWTVLLPEDEVVSVSWILFLPAELWVLRQFTNRHVLHAVIFVNIASIVFGVPIEVHAEWLGVTKGHSIFIKAQVGEVVLHGVRREEIFSNRVSEVVIVLMLPFGLTCLRSHQQHVTLGFVGRHNTKCHLDLRKLVGNVWVCHTTDNGIFSRFGRAAF